MSYPFGIQSRKLNASDFFILLTQSLASRASNRWLREPLIVGFESLSQRLERKLVTSRG